MLASVYALTFLLRGAGIAAPEASALADAACARRTLFAAGSLKSKHHRNRGSVIWRRHMTAVSYDGPEASYDGGVI